jgi:hypothetical protein
MRRTICSSMPSTKASSSADDWGGLSPLGASSPIVVVDAGAMVVSLWLRILNTPNCLWELIF